MAEHYIFIPEQPRQIIPIIRGLSALFWAIPLTLISSVQLSLGVYGQARDAVFPVAAFSLIAFGSFHLSKLRIIGDIRWKSLVEHLLTISLAQVLLSPFLFFLFRVPESPFFIVSIYVLGIFIIIYFRLLLSILERMTVIIGSQSFKQDFQWMKGFIEGALVVIFINWNVLFFRSHIADLSEMPAWFLIMDPHWLTSFLMISSLFPITVTMTLVWKVKEFLFEYALLHSFPGIPKENDANSEDSDPVSETDE